jgi:alpha-mannosidase
MTPKLHLIGNAHIDPVWLWSWQEGFQEILATFRSALDRLEEDSEFIFTASSAAFHEWVEAIDPKMFCEIQNRVSEGRWELAGGWWIEPDCNIPSGESLVRQALIAQGYFQTKFNRKARVGYAPDSFGHNAMLPQILQKSGMACYVFMRPAPHEKELPGRLFWWRSGDGSRVLAYQIPFTYCTWAEELTEHVEKCAAEAVPPVEERMCFYGVGNHGGGPTRENLTSLHAMQQRTDLPVLEFSSPERYFQQVESISGGFPVVQHGELQHHASGCYAAHSEIKQRMRTAENTLLAAEKWSVLAAITTGQIYPLEELTRAWKTLLFNQFHDILAGTSLESACEEACNQLGGVMATASQVLNAALQATALRIDIPAVPESSAWVVFNPHAWSGKTSMEFEVRGVTGGETLLDAQGEPVAYQFIQPEATTGWCRRVCFVSEVPALGYSVFRWVKNSSPDVSPGLIASDTCLENDRFRVEINPQSGAISSIRDKQHNLEILDGDAACGVVIDDPSDTWSHGVTRFDRVIGSFKPDSIRLVEQGPVKAVIRVISSYGDSRLVQEFALYKELPYIECKVTVDWREHFKILKLRFPIKLSNLSTFAEIPYGSIQRQPNGEEEVCHGWVDVSGNLRSSSQPYGVSILNNGKYSYDICGHVISLTVLRSPVYANHLPAVPQEGGYYSFMDQGIQHFQYHLVPHAGGWESGDTVRQAAMLNQPVRILPAFSHPGVLPLNHSFISVQPENIILCALKQAEDGGGWIIRAYETAGRETKAVINAPGMGRVVEIMFNLSEIKTLRIPVDAEQPVGETNLLEEWAV